MKAEDYAKLAPDAANWMTKPSRAACGACHDQMDWATGKSTITGRNDHQGGPQPNDAACGVCHAADSGKEFDASVVGAHTIPDRSKQLKGINVNILRVTNTAPGQNPNVIFTAKDNSGKNLLPSEITSLTVNLAGPSTDFVNQPSTENVALNRLTTGADGSFSYTMTRAISLNATGTYAIGIEARRTESIVGNNGATANVSGASYNPTFYVPVTDKVAVPRRIVVSSEACNVCHGKLAFHGGGRLNMTDYCQFCHNPAVVDVPQNVPPTLGGPFPVAPQSISLQLMIHRIHSGEELTRDFTIYRTRGVFNFNEIVFPGDRSNCAKCHEGTSYTLPLPDTLTKTIAPREFYSPLGPAAAACLGCHDNKPAAVHAKTMTDDVLGEACANCHGRGKDFDVQTVH
jgi:OmcA/MtrC family decaheme c-type cytochrome